MVELRPEAVAPAAVEVDDRLGADLIEDREQLPHRPLEPAAAERRRAEVGVGVDDRMSRAGRRAVDRPPQHRPRRVVGEPKLVAHPGREPQPLSPVSAMPRTKYFWAITNRMIIGSRLTIAPAIISGHFPTNWPSKNASPTVVVYWSRWRR